jgi:hypothetical protein
VMNPASDGSSDSPTKGVSNEDYAAFVGQVEMDTLWLMRGRVENRVGAVPEDARIRLEEHHMWVPIEGGFRAESRYCLRLVSKSRKLLGLVEAVFGVNYASATPMDDAIFATFGRHNLPFNTWPFYREYVATSFARMNWPAVILPLRKRLPATASESGEEK